MPAQRIGGRAARSALPAPVEAGDRPSPVGPVADDLKIFLDHVAASAQHQHPAATALAQPVAAQAPAVGRGPVIEPPVHRPRSEEHTSELQSLMRISYAVFCLKKKKKKTQQL